MNRDKTKGTKNTNKGKLRAANPFAGPSKMPSASTGRNHFQGPEKTSNKKFAHIVKEYGGVKVPLIEKIVVHIINESQTGWLNFLKGKIDLLELPKDNYSETFSASNELTPEMEKKGIVLGQTSSLTNVYYFGFNQK
ncbi:MAG: hypothetical protein IID18_01915, partial [Nitrospinae bacterium]|nr:hypothetical protein [Nitrospinota bacterium]